MSMKKRTDEYRESVIDPTDFVLADWPNTFKDYETSEGQCVMCGNRIRYAVGFRQLSTGDLITVGIDCAEYLDSDDRIQLQFKKWQTAEKNRRKKEEEAAEIERRRAEMQAESPDVVEFLENLDLDKEGNMFAFLHDMMFAYNKWGSLTEKQTSAVRNIMAKRAEFEARKVAEPKPEHPLEEGRYEMRGEVLSTKWVDNQFGGSRKMRVRLEDNNVVYGTVPKAVSDVRPGEGVLFTATVSRSNDDENFGFFSKPTKAVVL